MKFRDIKPGMTIINYSSGNSYIVTANYGDRITAVRTVDVTNGSEWHVLEVDGAKTQLHRIEMV